jgi:hypothetical protein
MLANLEKDPLDYHLDGRESLFKWSVGFHNQVNAQTGKSQWDYDDAFLLWKKICLGDLKDCNISTIDPRIKMFLWIVLFMLVSLLVAIFVWRIF